MNRQIWLLLTLALLLALSACAGETTPPEPVLPPPVVEQLLPQAEGQLLPEPPAANEGIRNRRRMDLDQLEAAILTATGGIYGDERRGRVPSSPDPWKAATDTMKTWSTCCLGFSVMPPECRDSSSNAVGDGSRRRIFLVQVSERHDRAIGGGGSGLAYAGALSQHAAGGWVSAPWPVVLALRVLRSVTTQPPLAHRLCRAHFHPDFYSY